MTDPIEIERRAATLHPAIMGVSCGPARDDGTFAVAVHSRGHGTEVLETLLARQREWAPVGLKPHLSVYEGCPEDWDQ